MRSTLLVRNASGCVSRVPTKLAPGLVPLFPVSVQALSAINAEVEIWDRRPDSAVTTTRSNSVSVAGVVPESDLKITLPLEAMTTCSCNTSSTKLWMRNNGTEGDAVPPITSNEPPPTTELPMTASPFELNLPLTFNGPVLRSPPLLRIARTRPLVTRRRSLGSLVPR